MNSEGCDPVVEIPLGQEMAHLWGIREDLKKEEKRQIEMFYQDAKNISF